MRFALENCFLFPQSPNFPFKMTFLLSTYLYEILRKLSCFIQKLQRNKIFSNQSQQKEQKFHFLEFFTKTENFFIRFTSISKFLVVSSLPSR